MFNIFKKKVTESPKDIIPPQVKSDMEYIERIYNQLNIMYDNGDSRLSIKCSKIIYNDEYIELMIESNNFTSYIMIKGKINTSEDSIRKLVICNTTVYHQNAFDHTLITYNPIKWEVLDECKANVLKHIEENILNDKQYESLPVQFCKRISNKGD